MEHARGMIFSKLANKTLIQSPPAMKFIQSIKTTNELIKSQPIMWGSYKNFRQNNINKSNRFIILHAGTYKPLCSTPWIYETSNTI